MTAHTREEFISAIDKLGLSAKQAAERLGVPVSTVGNIRRGRTWKNSVPEALRAAVAAIVAEAGKMNGHANSFADAVGGEGPSGKSRSKASQKEKSAEGASPRTANGLSPGFFHQGRSVWHTIVTKGKVLEHWLCSYMRALYRTTDGTGYAASIVVEVRNIHDELKQVRVPLAVARTEPKQAAKLLLDVLADSHGSPAQIVGAVIRADVPKARFVSRAGRYSFANGCVFALPSGVMGQALGVTVIWDGGTTLCRAKRSGTLDDWKADVAAPCAGNPIPMASIGTMLASPAIPSLDPRLEVNTMIHFVGNNTGGKTTSLRVGASVWGPGKPPSAPDSFVETWRTTSNASENLLAAHNHVGVALDELKLLRGADAERWAYEFSSGRSKHRMNADGGARRLIGWELFALSSGEKTLGDLTAEASFRRRGLDGGAETRVINIGAENVFMALHGEVDAKGLADRLGRSAGQVYGHAGPVFVVWLLANPDEARERLARLVLVWEHIALAVLPDGAAAQAARVAMRLGTIAVCAALGAEVIGLPWTPVDDDGLAVPIEQSGVDVRDAARATLWAFAELLKLWLTRHGGSASTDEARMFDDLRDFFHAHPASFFHSLFGKPAVQPTAAASFFSGGVPPRPDDDRETRHSPTSAPRYGWDVYNADGARLFVDFLGGPLMDSLVWSPTELRRAMRALDEKDLLITAEAGKLQFYRKEEPDPTTGKRSGASVYRVKAEFFSETEK